MSPGSCLANRVLLPKVSTDRDELLRVDSTGGSERTHDIVWRPPRAENAIVKGAGHLVSNKLPYDRIFCTSLTSNISHRQVMQEKPRQVAQAMYASLNGWTIEPDEKVFADKARL